MDNDKREDKLKSFLFRMKIFGWYITTEPWRQIRVMWEFLNRSLTWAWVIVFGMILALFLGKKIYAALFFVLLLVFIFLWEWNDGYFMHRYREHVKDRIKKKIGEDETLKKEIEDRGG